MLIDAVCVHQLDWIFACFSLSESTAAGNVFSRAV